MASILHATTTIKSAINGLQYRNVGVAGNTGGSSTKGKATLNFTTVTEVSSGKNVCELTKFGLFNDNDSFCIEVSNVSLSRETVLTLANALLQAADTMPVQ